MVSIAGANLSGAGASDLTFGGNAATGVVVVDDTTITATAPAGSGTVGVSVTTPSGTLPGGRLHLQRPAASERAAAAAEAVAPEAAAACSFCRGSRSGPRR